MRGVVVAFGVAGAVSSVFVVATACAAKPVSCPGNVPLKQPAGTNIHATDIVATDVACTTADAVASDAIANTGSDGVPKLYDVYGLYCKSGNPTISPDDGAQYDRWTCQSGAKTITFLVGGGVSPNLLAAPRLASLAGGAPSGPAGFDFTITQTAGCPKIGSTESQDLHFGVYNAAGQQVNQKYSFGQQEDSFSYQGGQTLSSGMWIQKTWYMATQSNWGPGTSYPVDLPTGRYTLKMWCLRHDGGNSTQTNYQNTSFTVTGPSILPVVSMSTSPSTGDHPVTSGATKCPAGTDIVFVSDDQPGVSIDGNAVLNPDGSWEDDNLVGTTPGVAYVHADCSAADATSLFDYGTAKVNFP